MGQQTAASIKAAAASPSGASQTFKPPSPSQPMMPQSNVQVGKKLARKQSDMTIVYDNDFYFNLFKQKSDWDSRLNADKAGAATNAEDFTKQFMSDMFGGGSSAAAPNEAPPPVPSAMKTREQTIFILFQIDFIAHK